jgi:hypothetical protein
MVGYNISPLKKEQKELIYKAFTKIDPAYGNPLPVPPAVACICTMNPCGSGSKPHIHKLKYTLWSFNIAVERSSML